MEKNENPSPAGAGAASQGHPGATSSRSFLNITALQLGAENADYQRMRQSEGLRNAYATPAQRVRWFDYRDGMHARLAERARARVGRWL